MQLPSHIVSIHSACAIRLPIPDDYDKMADLAGQLGYPSTSDQIKARVTEMWGSKQCAVYVAELPGARIVGWVGLYVFRTVEQDICAGISGLIVDRQIRSRGIGTLLLDAAANWARDQGCNAIFVHSNVTRERAHLFYEKHGYKYVKTQNLLHKAF